MSRYFLIQSRSPYQGPDARTCFDLACELARRGSDVVVYLVENGVTPTRAEAASALEPLANAGVTVLADDFSLRERGIDVRRLSPMVSAAEISQVVDAMASGAKIIWH